MKRLLVLCLFVIAQTSLAQTNSTTQAGYWNACATWGNPTYISNNGTGNMYINHSIIVPAGQTFYVSRFYFGPNGNLQFEANASLRTTPTGTDITCSGTPPTVSTLACGSASFSPATMVSGTAYSGTITVPYTGGNGSAYAAGAGIASTGVTGLTATLQAGTLASGSGNLTYTVTGTPSAAGTASFALVFGGQSCTASTTVSTAPPTVTSITCGSASFSPATMVSGTAYSGTITVPYTGGNGSAYSAGAGIASTGVTGLTATLQAGTLANGSGNLTYTVTGTPSAAGTASFALVFGGQSCSVSKTVSNPGITTATGGVTFSGARIECNITNSLTLTISYTGGNGGAYTPSDFSISGCDPSSISGISGTLNVGSGTVVVPISVTTSQGVNPCYTDVVFLGNHILLEITCSIDGGGGRMSIPRK